MDKEAAERLIAVEAAVVGPDSHAAPRAVGRRRVDPQPLRLGGSSGRGERRGKSSGFGGSRLPPARPPVVAEETERGEDLGGAEVDDLAEHGADEVGTVVVGESGDAARRRVREAAGLREREEDVVLTEARRLGADEGSNGGVAARALYGGRL